MNKSVKEELNKIFHLIKSNDPEIVFLGIMQLNEYDINKLSPLPRVEIWSLQQHAKSIIKTFSDNPDVAFANSMPYKAIVDGCRVFILRYF